MEYVLTFSPSTTFHSAFLKMAAQETCVASFPGMLYSTPGRQRALFQPPWPTPPSLCLRLRSLPISMSAGSAEATSVIPYTTPVQTALLLGWRRPPRWSFCPSSSLLSSLQSVQSF